MYLAPEECCRVARLQSCKVSKFYINYGSNWQQIFTNKEHRIDMKDTEFYLLCSVNSVQFPCPLCPFYFCGLLTQDSCLPLGDFAALQHLIIRTAGAGAAEKLGTNLNLALVNNFFPAEVTIGAAAGAAD
jgi:hypothetical protein